jgi:hypothetical protein
MRIRTVVLAGLAIGLVIGVPGAASAATTADDKVRAKLSGAAVLPGPGDPDGKGTFKGTVDGDTLCYRLKVKNVDGITGAHIHAGDSESVGPIVATLETGRHCLTAVPDEEDTEETLSQSELAAIQADPGSYYVDVHSEEFPDGAIRGQLR